MAATYQMGFTFQRKVAAKSDLTCFKPPVTAAMVMPATMGPKVNQGMLSVE